MDKRFEAFAIKEGKKVLIWDGDDAMIRARSYLDACDLSQTDASVIPEADNKITMSYDDFVDVVFNGENPFLTDIEGDSVRLDKVVPFGIKKDEYLKLLLAI